MFLDRHTFSELIFWKGFRQGRDQLNENTETPKIMKHHSPKLSGAG